MASTDSEPNINQTPRTVPVTNSRPSPAPAQPSFYINGKVFVVTGIILAIMLIFVGVAHFWSRVSVRRRRRSSIVWRFNRASPLSGGLDKASVNSLPTFTYTMPFCFEGGNAVSKEEADEGSVECSVCLLEFEENNECRLLPKCNHFFHVECIDKWFLSNTTCPLCRTSAEPQGISDVCHTESSTAFSLPCQELGDHAVGRMNVSPSNCLLPHQDSSRHTPWLGVNDGMQRSRAISPLNVELDGVGLHVRRMLARTRSNVDVDASYDLLGERTLNDTMNVAMFAENSSCISRDLTCRRNHAREASVRHRHLSYWRRSVSDKSLNTKEAMHFPSNVLFWGHHSRVDSHLHAGHWQIGEGSRPHISIDVQTLQENALKPQSALSSPTQCFSMGERARASPSWQHQPSGMDPSESDDSAFHLAGHGKT